MSGGAKLVQWEVRRELGAMLSPRYKPRREDRGCRGASTQLSYLAVSGRRRRTWFSWSQGARRDFLCTPLDRGGGCDRIPSFSRAWRSLGWPLDTHGVAVIDFTQSGSAAVYPALAEAFGIPWHMVVDGDAESTKFRQHILDRGFEQAEIAGQFATLSCHS
jgi:hypothetical protein